MISVAGSTTHYPMVNPIRIINSLETRDCHSIKSMVVHDSLAKIRNEETFLKKFVAILKHPFQNFEEMFPRYYMDSNDINMIKCSIT